MGASATKAAWDSAHQLKKERKVVSKLLAWYELAQRVLVSAEPTHHIRCCFECKRWVLSEDALQGEK